MRDKPIILALDTSTEACSAAIMRAGVCVWRFEKTANTHTALLLPMISSLLAETGLTLPQIDVIAVTRGPGSFTGVRIGIGIAQGMSLGLNKPVYEISTLQAIARTCGLTGRISVAIDARMQEVYTAVFDCDQENTLLVGQEKLCSPSQLAESLLPFQDHPVKLVGSGWDVYHAQLQTPHCWQHFPMQLPHAKAVAELAHSASLKGVEGVVAHDVTPIYLRDKVAEKAKVKSSVPL